MRKFVVLLAGVALAVAFGAEKASATKIKEAGAKQICGQRWRIDENGNGGCFFHGKNTDTLVQCGGGTPDCIVVVIRPGPHGGRPGPGGEVNRN